MPVEQFVPFTDEELDLHSNAHVTPLDNLTLPVKEQMG